jgi:hypothetical protein
MVLLMGIHILCKAGCVVIFTDTTCEVVYNTKVILRGFKDPPTDLRTLPMTPAAIFKTSQDLLARPVVAHTLACPLLGNGLVNQKKTRHATMCRVHPFDPNPSKYSENFPSILV